MARSSRLPFTVTQYTPKGHDGVAPVRVENPLVLKVDVGYDGHFDQGRTIAAIDCVGEGDSSKVEQGPPGEGGPTQLMVMRENRFHDERDAADRTIAIR